MDKSDFLGQKGHIELQTINKRAKIIAFSLKLIYFTLCLSNLSKQNIKMQNLAKKACFFLSKRALFVTSKLDQKGKNDSFS